MTRDENSLFWEMRQTKNVKKKIVGKDEMTFQFGKEFYFICCCCCCIYKI